MFLSKSKKSPFYQLTYEVNGKRTTVSTKATTKREAELFKYNFIQAEKESITQNEISSEKEIDLSTFAAEYFHYSSSTKSKSYLSSIHYAFKQLSNYLGNISLEAITTKHVDQFVTSTFSRTKRGAHQYFRTLKAAFNKAVEWEYIQSNPFSKVKFPRLTKAFPVFLTEDELQIIINNTQHEYLKDLFTVAFYTGLRLGELINMKWNWVDFDNSIITVKCDQSFTTKSKRERIVPMSNKVKAALRKRNNFNKIAENSPIFYRIKDVVLHDETVSKQFKAVIRKSQLNDKIHFHTLRHSFCSLLIQRGVSLYVVKELAGHEDITTTQIYSHLQQQNLREAINVF